MFCQGSSPISGAMLIYLPLVGTRTVPAFLARLLLSINEQRFQGGQAPNGIQPAALKFRKSSGWLGMLLFQKLP